MRQGAITAEDKQFVETWANIAEYSNVIVRLDPRGDEKPEVISGERQFFITTEERLITQGKILDAANDPFRNGSFRPITVPASVDVESNPNALSDEDIRKIFVASDLAFEEWLKTVDSPATIDRMVRLAKESDDLTMRRYRLLEERHFELHPKKRLTTSDEELAKFIGHGDQQPKPGGGRSTQYRS